MKPLLMGLALLAGLAIACGSSSSNDDSNGGSAASIGSVGSLGDSSAGVDAAPSASNVDASAARLVVTSEIGLEVDDLRAAYQTTGDIVRGLGGFVAEGRISQADGTDRDDETPFAFVRLRVPSEQHDALLAALRESARTVTREETTTSEVTAEYTDLQSRLTNLQRSEAQYQELLDRSGSIEDVLNVTARLDEVRGEIEQVQGRINLLGDQSDFATVAVTMSLPAVGVESSSGLPSPLRVFVDAAEGSVTVAHAVLNVGMVVLVAAFWLVPLGLAYLVLRRPVQRLLAASKARLS